jgi:hypothetical protein
LPYFLVLSTTTTAWLIVSGTLHNFNMYAASAFQMLFLIRYHGATLAGAGRLSNLLALAGIPGLLLGCIAGDRARRAHPSGRLIVGSVALLFRAPLTYLALGAGPRGGRHPWGGRHRWSYQAADGWVARNREYSSLPRLVLSELVALVAWVLRASDHVLHQRAQVRFGSRATTVVGHAALI